MRIISGKYKGLFLEGFTLVGTRPTMDRVKESLFAMLGQTVFESCCLDLFAGSGSLGIEALSNGAKEVYFVDHNPKAVATIEKNLKKIHGNELASVFKSDWKKALDTFAQNKKKFSIIFLDPPYQANLLNACIQKIKELDLLEENGLLVLEYENTKIENETFPIYKERHYGSKTIEIRKKM